MMRRLRAASSLIPCLLLAASTASAQPKPGDDDEVRPPPGTPGSTAQDEEVKPPPGTPGSTSSGDKPGTAAVPSGAAPKSAAKPDSEKPVVEDRFHAFATTRTFVRMFQRKYLAGLGDQIAEDETLVPVYEYASLRVGDIDAPWAKDSVDFRLDAWGVLDPADVSQDRRLSGDLTTASLTNRIGPAYVTLGRQVAAGGAARFTRFDGVATGVRSGYGLGADVYAGLVVTPRFHSRPEYVLLGSRADSMLKHPDALPSVGLADAWVVGGKLSYSRPEAFFAGLSLHEEHARGGLARRWGSLAIKALPTHKIVFGGDGAFDLDAKSLADARVYADYEPTETIEASAEVNHSDPGLFLSRSAVLSVFSLDTFTEAGGELTWRPIHRLRVGGSAFHTWYSDSSSANRFTGRVRAGWGTGDVLVTQLRYTRAYEAEMGYHAIRGSASYRIAAPLMATAEVHQYLYDEAVRGSNSATYGSATVEYGDVAKPWKLMFGGFVTRSPFADLDAQAIARLSYDIDLASGGTKK